MEISFINKSGSRPFKERFDLPNFILAVVSLVIFVIVYLSQPMNPLFIPENDSQSDFPHPSKNVFPTWGLAIIMVVVPLFVAFLMLLLRKRYSAFIKEFNPFSALWMYILIVVTSLTVTEIFKRYVGRARPDIYSVCGKNTQYEDCKSKLSSSKLKDQFKSWPSGHSSMSITSMYVVAAFIQEAVNCNHAYVAYLGVFFIAFAFFVASTRINDFRHHADDVVAGLLMGFIVSEFMWKKCKKEVFKEIVSEIEP